ncbi:hypothetical protein [Metamycoplasma canadense]|uniref:Lipoprotein n=1 Tax=Metamycoplasma canadense TaxID=29554 RepID=A0A077LC34_9BACT|nr:hypothetical protein [Metamycoplasma canadense]BAP39674.1 hypothetical protein MCAN360_0576 [Metamycoplasma canadense]
MKKKNRMLLGILGGVAFISSLISGITACVIAKNKVKPEQESKPTETPEEKKDKTELDKLIEDSISKEHEDQINVYSEYDKKVEEYWKNKSQTPPPPAPKLKSLDFSKFKDTLTKVKNALGTNDKLFKEGTWFKLKIKYDRIKNFMNTQKSGDNINKINQFLTTWKDEFDKTKISDIKVLERLDTQLLDYYNENIEILVFKQDYLNLVNYINNNELTVKDKIVSITKKVEDIEKENKQVVKTYQDGYRDLKETMLEEEHLLNFEKNEEEFLKFPEPYHYIMGQVEDIEDVYAQILATLILTHEQLFKKYSNESEIRRTLQSYTETVLDKENQDKRHKVYFAGILYAEKELVRIKKRIAIGVEMKDVYLKAQEEFKKSSDNEKLVQLEEIRKRINFKSTSIDVQNAIDAINELLKQTNNS